MVMVERIADKDTQMGKVGKMVEEKYTNEIEFPALNKARKTIKDLAVVYLSSHANLISKLYRKPEMAIDDIALKGDAASYVILISMAEFNMQQKATEKLALMTDEKLEDCWLTHIYIMSFMKQIGIMSNEKYLQLLVPVSFA